MPIPTIALDARLIGSGGTGDTTYWTNLLIGLRELQPEARFLLYSHQPEPPGLSHGDPIRWVVLPAQSARWWSLVQFPLAARRAGAQLLHTQYNVSPLAGRQSITTIHDVSFFIGPQWFKPRDRFLLKRFVPASARRARLVFAVSETCQREIEQFIPAARGKVRVTLNARRQTIGPMAEAAAAALRRTMGVRDPYLLTVGTRWPRKNMSLATEAVSLLPGAMDHMLVVSGAVGWDQERESQRVLRVGYRSDQELSALYQGASLYLAPSCHEGFGIPLLEAFACGAPVLCSAGGAFPEVAGDAAYVEAAWDAPTWAKRIEALLADSSKLDSMRELGRARERLFTPRRLAGSVWSGYQEALS